MATPKTRIFTSRRAAVHKSYFAALLLRPRLNHDQHAIDATTCAQADGTPQLYDFQYCGKACPAKDVAYCLCCGSSAWDEADDLARGYHRDLSAALASRGEEAPELDAFLETLELAYADLGRWMSGWGWWGNDLEPRITGLLDRLDGGTALASSSEYEAAVAREFPV